MSTTETIPSTIPLLCIPGLPGSTVSTSPSSMAMLRAGDASTPLRSTFQITFMDVLGKTFLMDRDENGDLHRAEVLRRADDLNDDLDSCVVKIGEELLLMTIQHVDWQAERGPHPKKASTETPGFDNKRLTTMLLNGRNAVMPYHGRIRSNTAVRTTANVVHPPPPFEDAESSPLCSFHALRWQGWSFSCGFAPGR